MKSTASVLLLSLCFASPAFAQNAATSAPMSDDHLAATIRDTRERAERGDAKAQFDLGKSYYDGRGVLKDDAQAVVWFRKAADQGYAEAQYWLGGMYEDGDGVTKDEAQAAEWYRKAAAWWQKATDQGDAKAQFNLVA